MADCYRIRGLEKNEEIRFKSNVLSSEQYTLKIAGCGKVQNIWEYLNDLIDHFQDVINCNNENFFILVEFSPNE